MSTDSTVVKHNPIPTARFIIKVRGGHEGVFDHYMRGDHERSTTCFKECRDAVLGRLSLMDVAALAYLAMNISDGQIDECVTEKNLVHTLARFLGMRPAVVAFQFKLVEQDHCSYWFKQLNNSSPDCKFTNITLAWILSVAESSYEPDPVHVAGPKFLRELFCSEYDGEWRQNITRIRNSIDKVAARPK